MRLKLLASFIFYALVSSQKWQLVAKPVCNEAIVGGFTHPGIFHSCEDLTRAQTEVWSREEPWFTAFGRMFNESLVGLSVGGVNAYNIRGPLPALPYGQDAWSSNFTVDAQYAYLNALAYFITGHPFHRERALRATRRWLTKLNLLEEYIRGGNRLRYLTAAYEIMRSITTSWWTANDTQLYHDFAKRVRRNWDSTNDMARNDLFFNQGAYANGGACSMTVFLGDVDLYQQIIKQVTVGTNPDPSIDYAISKQIHNDTGYKGQVAEMGRDQAHPAGVLNIVSSMANTAEIQGDLGGQIEYVDLFKYDDYRFLDGLEYFSRFNLGHDVPYKTLQIGRALNAPTAAYYRYKELVPECIRYFKTYIESQTLGYDSLLYMRKGNYEDLQFIWDLGYGASFLEVISGPGAYRRRWTQNETAEGRFRNSTFPDIGVVKANTTISYTAFISTQTKPFLQVEARSDDGTEVVVTNQLEEEIARLQVPSGDRFHTVYHNTSLEAKAPAQFLYLWTSDDVEIARFNMTEASVACEMNVQLGQHPAACDHLVPWTF
ncbi:hypothetical protein NW759_011484 [Fusarium solani]|nr:hypothetical protein NW759_011484 [Fusarium solani]